METSVTTVASRPISFAFTGLCCLQHSVSLVYVYHRIHISNLFGQHDLIELECCSEDEATHVSANRFILSRAQ